MVLCSPDGKDPNSYGPVWAPAGLGVEPALSPVQVAQVARNRLRLPEVIIGASPAGEQLVNLPTWLWLRSDWQQVSATATVAGASVTATATPISVVWSMGDGATVTCPGPGSTFPTGSTPESASPDCGYTYRSSSAGQRDEAYPVTTTVTWKVAWSGAGQSGVFPNLTVSASTAFRVAESQAINTG
jgi:hypothetical protein